MLGYERSNFNQFVKTNDKGSPPFMKGKCRGLSISDDIIYNFHYILIPSIWYSSLWCILGCLCTHDQATVSSCYLFTFPAWSICSVIINHSNPFCLVTFLFPLVVCGYSLCQVWPRYFPFLFCIKKNNTFLTLDGVFIVFIWYIRNPFIMQSNTQYTFPYSNYSPNSVSTSQVCVLFYWTARTSCFYEG